MISDSLVTFMKSSWKWPCLFNVYRLKDADEIVNYENFFCEIKQKLYLWIFGHVIF